MLSICNRSRQRELAEECDESLIDMEERRTKLTSLIVGDGSENDMLEQHADASLASDKKGANKVDRRLQASQVEELTSIDALIDEVLLAKNIVRSVGNSASSQKSRPRDPSFEHTFKSGVPPGFE
jgi:hypothetical protein